MISTTVKRAVAAAALAIGVTAALANAAGSPGATCAAAKRKAAIQRYAGELKCYLTALKKGVAVDSECLAKAQSKFTAAFAKAEAGGDCATTGDAAGVAALIDGQLGTLNATLPDINPFVCDIGSAGETDCVTCLNCTLGEDMPCEQQAADCNANQDCLDFGGCINLCVDDYDYCVSQCVQAHPSGVQLYSLMLQCAQGSCPVTCTF